jgi:hypothetical protein
MKQRQQRQDTHRGICKIPSYAYPYDCSNEFGSCRWPLLALPGPSRSPNFPHLHVQKPFYIEIRGLAREGSLNCNFFNSGLEGPTRSREKIQ